MGYRNYLSIVEKEEINIIQKMNYEQLAKAYGEDVCGDLIFAPYNLPQVILHNLGDLDKVDADRMYSVGKPLFSSEEVNQELEHYKLYLLGKEGLIELIQLYRDKVISHFQGLLVDDTRGWLDDKTAPQKQEAYVKSMLSEWEKFPPINMNEDTNVISTSWKYEYIIFELVRQLKTVDFEKNTLIFYGY